MAADLGEFTGDDTDCHPRSKRPSFAAMGGHDNTPLASSPLTGPTRTTPPHTALTLERPMPENILTPSPPSTNGAGMTPSRQFGGLDHDIAKFAQSVSIFLAIKLTFYSLLHGQLMYDSNTM